MKNGNVELALVLTGRDDGAKRLVAQTQQQLERTEKSRERLERQSRAYALTGVRSEREIRREIIQTQAAFNRLARSGKASQNDLARAAVATRNRIRELNAELKQGAGLADRMGGIGRAGMAAVAGGAAAYAALKPAMDDRKQLDENLNRVSRQAFVGDEDKSAAWIATEGARQIKDLTVELVSKQGGNHDKALELISGMMTTGLNFAQTKEEAQAAYAFSLASEGGGVDTAKLIKTLKDGGLNGRDLNLALEHVLQSGLDGTFEVRDMVRELPALLPAAQQAGMTGIGGLDYLLSLLQSAANKSGSPAEAATNVQNLLSKTLSKDTVKRLKDMANPKDPKKGVDWVGSILKGKENGENAVQVLARLADSMLAKDRQFQDFQKRAAAGDKTAAEQANMLKGALLATLLPDLQAKQGLLAASDMAQIQGYMAKLGGVTPENGKIGKMNEAAGMTDAARQEKAKSLALLNESLTETLNNAETAFKELSAEYPNATLAIRAMTAAAAGFAATAALSGGLGGIKGAGGKIAGGAKNAAASAAGALVSRPDLLGRLGIYGMLLAPRTLADGTLPREMRESRSAADDAAHLRRAGIRFLPSKRTAAGTPLVSAQNAATPPDKLLSPLFSTQTAAYQAALLQQTAAFQTALSADTAAVTAGLDRMFSALASAGGTIETNVSLNIDGRTVANEVSRHQYSLLNRGAGL
ncbi:PRTRC system protein F [Neisseria blantyrii]|uniref:PRTRC system protein F n=1 Tax=Neisseria blantyrii TaxID=2830647 RepID=UPI00272CBC3E|nr:PRTRC system protein F [Neisseria blantyrii]